VPVVKNAIGKKFGRWTILKFDKVNKGQGSMFVARCDCGEERSLLYKSLRDGNSKSCGCIQRLPPGEAVRNKIFRVYQYGAEQRDLPFDIDIDLFTTLTSSNCFYCDCTPQQANGQMDRYNERYTYNGIDRLDSSKGYSKENCVACCVECNLMKRAIPYDVFMSKCLAIVSVYHDRIR
jgi:hypothetical protein